MNLRSVLRVVPGIGGGIIAWQQVRIIRYTFGGLFGQLEFEIHRPTVKLP